MALYTVFRDYLTILVNILVFLYCMVKNVFVQTVHGKKRKDFVV